MTRREAETELAQLLLEQRRLAQFGLSLSPAARQRLRSLELRLGYTKMSRRTVVRRFAKTPKAPTPTYSDLVTHAAAAMDNPHDDVAMRAFADHLAETHPGPMAEDFLGWVNGEKTHRDLNPYAHARHILGYTVHGPYDPPITGPHAAEAPDVELRQHTAYTPAGTPALPAFGKRWDEPGWHLRTTRGASRSDLVTRRAGKRTVPTVDVAHQLYTTAGPGALVAAMVGLRHYRPQNVEHHDNPRGADGRGFRFTRRSAVEGLRPVVRRYALDIHETTDDPLVVSYARITLSPPRPEVGFRGETVNHHDLVDEGGNAVGRVKVTPRNDGKHLHIGWIGAGDQNTGNVLGAEAMRTALASLRTHYPDAEYVSGLRTSGFRAPGGDANEVDVTKPVERTVVALPRRRALSRRGTGTPVVRLAKAERTRHKAHPLLDGFPIAEALRHMANDASRSDSVRHLAKHALTTGDPSALWGLHDAVQEDGKGVPGGYNLMSAADKIHLDARVHTALEKMNAERKDQVPVDHHDLPHLTPGYIATLAERALRKGEGRADQFRRDNLRVRRDIHQRVLAVHPETDPKLIDESIRRHAHRHWDDNERRLSEDGHTTTRRAALEPPVQGTKNPDYFKAVTATRYRRRMVVKYAKPHNRNFIDALRRMQSRNHTALTDAASSVARRMGIADTHVLPALHDDKGTAVPGVAQAVYGAVRPESVHALAAWVNGLLPDGPGYAVFHARPTGPDTLYRMRTEGSGMDVRTKLDRHGITSRVLIPHRKGFDVLIPDKGNALGQNVTSYAQTHGLQVEASPGHFQTVGNTDPSAARATMRDKVVQGERPSGGPQRQSREVRRYTSVRPEPAPEPEPTPPPAYTPYAWPGGYPLVHWHEGSGIPLCAGCANEFVSNNPGETLHSEPHYEGPPVTCGDCGVDIESAYGDPDAEEPQQMARPSSPKRYGATHGDVTNLLTQLRHPDHAAHMAGLDDPLGGLRGVAADALDEQGRGDEATLLRTPGTHVEVRADGRVAPSFMERQTYGPTYPSGNRPNEQFVKPSYDGPRDEGTPDASHGFTFWFAQYGKPQRLQAVPTGTGGHVHRMVTDESAPDQWWWNPADGEGVDEEYLDSEHPRYRQYPQTEHLEDAHPLSPSEVAWMRSEATTEPFRRSRTGTTGGRGAGGRGPGGVGVPSSPKRYGGAGESVPDLKVPVYYEGAAGTQLNFYAPLKVGGRWKWSHHSQDGYYGDAAAVKEVYPHALSWDEMFGKRDGGRGMDMTPEEVHIATDGREGTPPDPRDAERDLGRSNETTPEDFYAMTRREAVRRYANRRPRQKSGSFTPEQHSLFERAHATDDRTAWGALGDHLAETGHAAAGAVLSQCATGHPDSVLTSGGNDHYDLQPGRFRYYYAPFAGYANHVLVARHSDGTPLYAAYTDHDDKPQRLSRTPRRRVLQCR